MATCRTTNSASATLEKKCFLADAQHRLSVQCCRVLTELTTRTCKSFLSVAGRGRSPTPADGRAGERVDETGRFDEFSVHDEAYRSVRSAIAASCTLGHRSCHVLWGPRGCGKHRILRLVAQDCMQRDGTLVLCLNGDTLNSDEDGLRSISQQILQFLKSPQSSKVRAADVSLRTGTFDFGTLFGFSKVMSVENDVSSDGASDSIDSDDVLSSVPTRVAARRRKKIRKEEQEEKKKETRKRTRLPSPVQSESESGSGEEDENPLFVTSTDACVTGGVTSALPALQRALLLMKGYGTNLVICIRRLERFSIRCDQLLYLLSGLMHESDVRGGGMSLLMTSSTPDIRQLEKRLSSRLTCESRCIPLLPWTLTRVVRACLTEVKERLQKHLDKKAAAQLKNKGRKKASDEVVSVTEMNHVANPLTGWRFDVVGATEQQEHDEKMSLGAPSNSMYNQTQVLEETMLKMVTVVMEELDAAAKAKPELLGEAVFAQRVTQVSGQLRSIGATAGRVVAAVSAAFGEVCSGRLCFFNNASCRSILFWLSRRLKQDDKESNICGTFSTAPEAVRALWLSSSFRNSSLSATGVDGPATASSSFSGGHQLLFDDLLADCRLVDLGYCSRETFLILVYVYLRHEAGVTRTVVDLLEDVASSMGTQAAAALDRAAFRSAIVALQRWRILRVPGGSGSSVVSLRGSPARVREFLQTVLRRADYCGSVLGLEAREITRLRSLLSC